MRKYILYTKKFAWCIITDENNIITNTFPHRQHVIGKNIYDVRHTLLTIKHIPYAYIKEVRSPKIIGFAGKLQSGKNTCGNYIFGKCMKELNFIDKFRINDSGKLICILDGESYVTDPLTRYDKLREWYKKTIWAFVKLYSFADELKEFCVNILGLSAKQVWGTNEDKSSLTNITWENLPYLTQQDFANFIEELNNNQYNNKLMKKYIPNKTGKMTAREVLQYFGTNIIRRMCPDAWATATIRNIYRDFPALAVIIDVRFPNEVEFIQKHGGKVIKLTRSPIIDKHESESMIDNLQDNKFDAIIDNQNISISEQNKQILSFLNQWGYNVWR